MAKRKEYRETNRQVINEKKKEKITCLFGAVITRDHMARHYTSAKHKQFINSKEDEVDGDDEE